MCKTDSVMRYCVANHLKCSCVYDLVCIDHESAINYYYILLYYIKIGQKFRLTPGPREKRRILPESTSAPQMHGHLFSRVLSVESASPQTIFEF